MRWDLTPNHAKDSEAKGSEGVGRAAVYSIHTLYVGMYNFGSDVDADDEPVDVWAQLVETQARSMMNCQMILEGIQ